jgi:hypothetical protein
MNLRNDNRNFVEYSTCIIMYSHVYVENEDKWKTFDTKPTEKEDTIYKGTSFGVFFHSLLEECKQKPLVCEPRDSLDLIESRSDSSNGGSSFCSSESSGESSSDSSSANMSETLEDFNLSQGNKTGTLLYVPGETNPFFSIRFINYMLETVLPYVPVVTQIMFESLGDLATEGHNWAAEFWNRILKIDEQEAMGNYELVVTLRRQKK